VLHRSSDVDLELPPYFEERRSCVRKVEREDAKQVFDDAEMTVLHDRMIEPGVIVMTNPERSLWFVSVWEKPSCLLEL
jgi:hypothetical protein